MAEERGISDINQVFNPAAAADESTAPPPSRWRRRFTFIVVAITLIAAAIVLPPLINIGRYQRQITALVSRSVGRPVHLSSVELRLLPSPGFVLHDLSISEDPAFGAEPILSARTVVASVRLFSLWRGKMEISRISVDEASLNLVRAADGRWNLESLMMGAQPGLTSASATGTPAPNTSRNFPYLGATSSRVNFKNGQEKSPYSLVNTDLSLWQDEPGQWRVRLLGQPVRTDIEMSQADAGEVRIEASLGSAPQLRDMPLKLQMDWRDAQLGQLSRLASGSDAGWRGDITANIEIHGTLDAAQTKARLRATSVHREEFAPDTPLDLDANCSFRYQHSQGAFHEVSCDTAIGEGRLHLKAEVPGISASQTAQSPQATPQATLEVRQVPLQAVLDVLRTVRGGFAPGLTAKGTVQGTLAYQEAATAPLPTNKPQRPFKTAKSKSPASQPVPAPVTGSLTLNGAILRGGALKEPLVLPASILWTPNIVPNTQATGLPAVRLGTQFTLTLPAAPTLAPAAAQAPQSVAIRFGASMRGYDASATGSIAPGRLRDLAYAFGFPHLDAADALSGSPADMDMQANGPWLSTEIPTSIEPTAATGLGDSITANLKLHHAQWRAPFLASPVDLSQGSATLTADQVSLVSEFTYGDPKSSTKNTLRGTIDLSAPLSCTAQTSATDSGANCQPHATLHFGALDIATVEAALIGAPAKKSLLAPLLNRIRNEDHPKWPPLSLTVDADSLVLGPVTLTHPTLQLRLKPTEASIESWTANALEGAATGTGHLEWANGQPRYSLTGSFTGINPTELGSLLGAQWSGNPIDGSGDITLSGLNSQELASSAAGHLKFAWPKGTMAAASASPNHPSSIHFDQWTGTFDIHAGKADLGDNALVTSKHTSTVKGSIALGGVTRLTVGNTTITAKASSKATPASNDTAPAQSDQPADQSTDKPAENQETKPESKPEVKPEAKPDAKPDQKPEP